MRIEDLIKRLAKCDATKPVVFDFCGLSPTSVSSWRGVYAEAALGWAPRDEAKYPVVKNLVAELHKALEGTYHGWKGGDYTYGPHTVLHVDNPGKCTNTEIFDVVEDDSFVVLRTEHRP